MKFLKEKGNIKINAVLHLKKERATGGMLFEIPRAIIKFHDQINVAARAIIKPAEKLDRLIVFKFI